MGPERVPGIPNPNRDWEIPGINIHGLILFTGTRKVIGWEDWVFVPVK